MFFIHTPIFTNVNRGYILGEIHQVSTQILDENACKYNIKHNIKLTTKNQKAISEISGFSFLLTLIGILDDLFNMYSKIANQIYSFFASTFSTLKKIAYKLPH